MRTFVLGGLAALTVFGCRAEPARRHKPLPPERAAEMLHERIWLDHAPRDPADRFQLVLFEPRGNGIMQARNMWKGSFELFFWAVDGGEIEFHLPGSGSEARSTFHVVKMAGPDHADMRLIVDHPPTGPREYWGWRFEGHDADAWVAEHFGDRPAQP